MPRKYCRLVLEVTEVRAQRLQQISNGDILAEGLKQPVGPPRPTARLRENFHAGWDVLNAKRGWGWDMNPWVWAITFKKVLEP
jgi:hypothetical protein